jgi:hypothetical protein
VSWDGFLCPVKEVGVPELAEWLKWYSTCLASVSSNPSTTKKKKSSSSKKENTQAPSEVKDGLSARWLRLYSELLVELSQKTLALILIVLFTSCMTLNKELTFSVKMEILAVFCVL